MKKWREYLFPLVFMLVFILCWQFAIIIFKINQFILPAPLTVFNSFVENFREIIYAIFNSMSIAIIGLGISILVGIIIGTIMSFSTIIERSVYPYAIFLQCVPIVAMAPIIILWFGYGVPAMIAIAFIISLFPIITATVNGLKSIPKDYLELLKLYKASKLQILLKIRFPSAIPFIITGIKVSAGLSVVGAIIGEYFAGLSGTSRGLAYLIRSNEQNADFPYLFATVIAAAILGLTIFTATSLLSSFIIKKFHFQEKN